jgi:hypothetical protein
MTRALVLTKGHPFDEAAWLALWDGLSTQGVTADHVEHPDGRQRLHPDRLASDVVVLYDMPGLRFRRDAPPEALPPPPEVIDGLSACTAAGVPFLVLHHALAGWPAWPAYAEMIGGRFSYVPVSVRGTSWPDSGYCHAVQQTFTVVAPDHPVTAGLPQRFGFADETYLCPVFDADIEPLLLTDAPRDAGHHWSSAAAVAGRMNDRTGWTHPDGSPLAAWVRRHERSTIVYVQPGDGPSAYGDTNYRRLLANALHWLATTRT